MENITKPVVVPPPLPPKEPQKSNKVLISVIIVIGIIMVVLAIDYFIGKDNNPSPVKQEETVQKPEAEIPTINNPPIDSTNVPSVSTDNTTLNETNVKEQPAPPPSKVSEERKQVNNEKAPSNPPPPTPLPSNPPPPLAKLNDLLNRITSSDDYATDEIRKVLGNSLLVEGAANISNVQELITDVSKGSRYRVTKVNTNADGKVISISVSK